MRQQKTNDFLTPIVNQMYRMRFHFYVRYKKILIPTLWEFSFLINWIPKLFKDYTIFFFFFVSFDHSNWIHTHSHILIKSVNESLECNLFSQHLALVFAKCKFISPNVRQTIYLNSKLYMKTICLNTLQSPQTTNVLSFGLFVCVYCMRDSECGWLCITDR